MLPRWLVLAFMLPLMPLAGAQITPDLGPTAKPVDEAAGTVIPPALDTVYSVLGQNITQEDVRLFLDLNITKSEITPLGFLVGSGNVEIQADIHIRGELRVISSDRIRALVEGDNPYNLSAENVTFLTDVYLPAEVFRATLAAEVIAAFQEDMEGKMVDFIENTVPELEVLGVNMEWSNTSPLIVLSDLSLSEPPIVLEIDATVQYLRVESIKNLLQIYLASQDMEGGEGESDYVKRAKAQAADPLRTRDFFAAAAYDQMLNLSMQPGWSLEVSLAVPRGYSFEYTNEQVSRPSPRELHFTVDGDQTSEESPLVFIASITHRSAVALMLLLGMLAAVAVVSFPLGIVYRRFRLRPAKQPAVPDRVAGPVVA